MNMKFVFRLLIASLIAMAIPFMASASTLFSLGADSNTESVDDSSERRVGNISGVLLDPSGSTLPGALLKLNKDNRYTISKVDGSFVFLGVPEGTYEISVSYLGMQEYIGSVTVKGGENVSFEIQMEEAFYTTGEVVVVGELAKGQARALNKERNNSNITNMLAADQIGRFPDSNVGDALKRMPGITMQNDQGEARNIVVRGMASHLNSVTLNGGRIPSAEGDNRNVQMDLIPSDMISMVEVNKTLLPDMEADAIGGSVNLVTKAAPRHQRISAQLGGGYNPIRTSGTYNGSFTYGNRFFNDKLGAVLSLSYMNKDYGSDNIEAAWVKDKKDNPFIETFEIRKYDVQRVRRSASLNFDYKFNDNHSVYLNTLYNWRDDRENRFRYRVRKVKPEDKENIMNGMVGEADRQTKGGIDNNRNRNRRLEDQRVINVALGGEHLLGSIVEMDWSGSFSRASEHRPHERYLNYQAKKLAVTENLSDGIYPRVDAPEVKIGDFKLKEISESEQYTNEDEWSGKLNFRIPFSIVNDQKGRLRFGTKVNFKAKKRDNDFYEYAPIEEFGRLDAIENITWADKNFLNGKGYVPGTFGSHKLLGSLDLQNSKLFEKSEVLEEFWTANYSAKESVYSGYLRWDQNLSNKLLMILGLRVEHTSIDYIGHTLIDDEKGKDIQNTNKYTNLFPNLTLRYEPIEKLVLRGAFSTSIARPNYYWLVPYTMIVSDDAQIATGNSKLKSTYAYNFDLIGSYYSGNVGHFSLGLFYKRLNDFIYTYATKTYTTADFAREFPTLNNPIPDGEKWRYKTHRNGDNVDLYGFEVSYNRQLDFFPSLFLKRFSIFLNYTYTHSKAKGITNAEGDVREGMQLPGSAPQTLNASLAYEDSKFMARLSLNHAAAYVDELGAEAFEDAYYGAQTFLDFNASYKIMPNLQIYLDCNNLLNTPLFYYQGVKDRLMQLEFYKPTFTAGLRWNL